MRQALIAVFASFLLLDLSAASRPALADICVADTLKVSHVSGRVISTSRVGEEPISNASIELQVFRHDEWQTKFTATSNAQGFFEIEGVPSGTYQILVKAVNFSSFGTRVRLRASKSNPTREIVVTLGLGFHDCGSAIVRKLNRT